MTSKGHALAREELVRALTAYTGITTDDGLGDGTTLIDENLDGRNDFVTGKTILIMSGGAKDEDRGAITFSSAHPATITVTPAFSARIMRGTIFRILNISSVEIDVANIIASLGRLREPLEFWSEYQEEVQLTSVAATKTLPSVTVSGIPSGATVRRAIAMLKFRVVENTNAAVNSLDGATVAATSQVIQVRDDTPGTWRDAINFVDDNYSLPGGPDVREGGDLAPSPGTIDISAEVDGDDIYEFQWLLAKANQDNLQFNDVQVGLRIWYSI